MTNNVPDITMADQQAILNRSASEILRGAWLFSHDDMIRPARKLAANVVLSHMDEQMRPCKTPLYAGTLKQGETCQGNQQGSCTVTYNPSTTS